MGEGVWIISSGGRGDVSAASGGEFAAQAQRNKVLIISEEIIIFPNFFKFPPPFISLYRLVRAFIV